MIFVEIEGFLWYRGGEIEEDWRARRFGKRRRFGDFKHLIITAPRIDQLHHHRAKRQDVLINHNPQQIPHSPSPLLPLDSILTRNRPSGNPHQITLTHPRSITQTGRQTNDQIRRVHQITLFAILHFSQDFHHARQNDQRGRRKGGKKCRANMGDRGEWSSRERTGLNDRIE